MLLRAKPLLQVEDDGKILQKATQILLVMNVEVQSSQPFFQVCIPLSGNGMPLLSAPDDDVALYCYFGFSLHASIARKPRPWSHHLRRKICPEKRRKMSAQLEHLLETDKTVIPVSGSQQV